MESNPSVTLAGEPQWLHPVQLGTSTLLRLAQSPEALQAVTAVLARLQPDPYVEFMQHYYALGRERFGDGWGYADQLTVLHAAARLLRPRRYLEIGVFRGRSLSVVASVTPECELYGFDLWVENYAGLENSGPELVRRQLQSVGHRAAAHFVSGSSHETVPAFFGAHPGLDFDLVTVDGDHTEDGARRDLEAVLPHLSVGGVLVFDDIRHPKHPWLERVWDEVVGAHPGFASAKYVEVGHGVAFGVRRDPDSQPMARLRGGADERLKLLAQALDEVRRECDERLEAAEADGAHRLQIIQRQGDQIGQLEAERNELRPKVEELQRHLRRVEEDRATRLAIIERQGVQIGLVEADRNELRLHVEQLRAHLERIESDRALRLDVIERQGLRIGELERSSADQAARLTELEQEQARELLRLVRHGDRVDETRAQARKTLGGILTPGRVQLLIHMLDQMAADLAPTAAGRGAA